MVERKSVVIYGPRSKKLKTVDEHNAERRAVWESLRPGIPSGIACPVCGNEMLIPINQVSQTVYYDPPRKNVYCPKCNRWESVLA